jgi:protein tyrosine/serine phosphatase
MHRFSFLALLATLSISITPALSATWKSVADLPRYVVVAPGIFRGGQPSENGLSQLRDHGVKTIVSLRNNHALTQLESSAANKLGIEFVSIPLTGIQKPSDASIKKFLSIVEDPAKLPVFVHCEEGVDRTGTMIGIYRIADEHWSAENAYREMVQRGFHPQYFWLADAVFDYGGSSVQPVRGRPLPVKMLDLFENAISFLKL